MDPTLEDLTAERDRLREAILEHRGAARPAQRSMRDWRLYEVLAAATLDPTAAEHLRREREYFDWPYA